MFLYFNGDSHTEGAGLSDCDFFPDEYPGNFISDINNFKPIDRTWSEWLYSYGSKNKHIWGKLRNANMQLGYPAQLQKLLGCEIYNNAVGGSGMFSIMSRTMHDLEVLAKKNKIPDQVFIGLTTIERIGIPSEEKFLDDATKWVHTALPITAHNLTDKWRNYAESHWTSHTDEQLLIFFLYQCAAIKYAVKSITGRDPIFLNTAIRWDHNHSIVRDSDNGMLRYVWASLGFDSIRDQISFDQIGFPLGQVADGHFCREAHIEYANYLAQTYFHHPS